MPCPARGHTRYVCEDSQRLHDVLGLDTHARTSKILVDLNNQYSWTSMLLLLFFKLEM